MALVYAFSLTLSSNDHCVAARIISRIFQTSAGGIDRPIVRTII